MKDFEFRITDTRGLHAQVAAELAEYAQKSVSQVYLTRGSKNVNMERALEVMSLMAGPGDLVRVTVMGEDEETVYAYLRTYFETHL